MILKGRDFLGLKDFCREELEGILAFAAEMKSGDRTLNLQDRNLAEPGAIFMDCMPLIHGDEATEEVVEGPRSLRYDEAENRLHVQKAILASLL